jgi:hypothetical protein
MIYRFLELIGRGHLGVVQTLAFLRNMEFGLVLDILLDALKSKFRTTTFLGETSTGG